MFLCNLFGFCYLYFRISGNKHYLLRNTTLFYLDGKKMIRNSSFGPRLVREYNELNILRFIKNDGPISRADIAKRYKISKAAVSEIINNLLEQGYVFETGIGNSTRLGGRRPIMLEFNPKAGYSFGIEIKRDHAWAALSDLNAHIHEKKIIKYETHTPLNVILENIWEVLDAMLRKNWVRKAKPMGIGVGIPGVINYQSGRIEESDSLKEWQGFPLRDAFEKRYNVETIIENDVKANSLAESRFGSGKGAQNQIYLWIGDGLGAGIIINGELYRGASAGAGEIGYLKPCENLSDKQPYKYLFHKQKTFAELLSEKALIKAARKLLTNDSLTMEDYRLLVEKEQKQATELLREYADLTACICIDLVNTLDPELIIIGGNELAGNKTFLKYVKERLKSGVLKTSGKTVHIKSAALKDSAGILGPVALVLEDIFYMDRLNIMRYRDVFGFKR